METCIEIQELSFAYYNGHPALQRLSLSVGQGEKVALVGPNGAGKSTLLLHLNGILQGEGMVQVMGQKVAEPNLSHIRGQVGLIFQNPDDQLFSPTVFDDVAFGPLYAGLAEEQVHHRVEWALAQVGMGEYAAIASVLSMQPEILALDEPTAGLDPRTRRRLIGLLQQLPQTMLCATHDLPMLPEVFARTVVLDRGQVVADGPTDEILADDLLLEAHGLK